MMMDFCEEREQRRQYAQRYSEVITGRIIDMQFYDLIYLDEYHYMIRRWVFKIDTEDQGIEDFYLTRGQFKLLRKYGIGWGSRIRMRVSERGCCIYMTLLSRKRKLKKHKKKFKPAKKKPERRSVEGLPSAESTLQELKELDDLDVPDGDELKELEELDALMLVDDEI